MRTILNSHRLPHKSASRASLHSMQKAKTASNQMMQTVHKQAMNERFLRCRNILFFHLAMIVGRLFLSINQANLRSTSKHSRSSRPTVERPHAFSNSIKPALKAVSTSRTGSFKIDDFSKSCTLTTKRSTLYQAQIT